MKCLRSAAARICLGLIQLILMLGLFSARGEGLYSNSWARVSPTGNLLYRHDEHGVRLPDFSQCGYQGGAVELPDVMRKIEPSRWINVSPSGNALDHADLIQNALNAAGQFAPNSNGFRGLVLLAPGDYRVGRTLVVSNSGVVLKGAGRDQSTGSRLWATNLVQHTLLEVRGPENSRLPSEQRYPLIEPRIPAGTRTFKLLDTAGLSVGQQVLITRPFTANWISEIDMDHLHTIYCPSFGPCLTNGLEKNWKTDRSLTFGRRITRLEGSWVTVDSPLPQTFESQYGGGFLQPLSRLAQIENIGIEDLFIGSYYHPTNALGYPSTSDERHAWRGIQVTAATDVWIRRVTGRYFGFSVVELTDDTSYATVAECRSIDPISKIAGNRRYAFHLDKGEHNLIRDCESDESRHDFAFGSLVPGPNANVRGKVTDTHADCGPHMGWSVGGLYDLINIDGTWWSEFLGKVGINVQNRGRNSSGHGWAGAYMTVWNCQADTFRVRNPPTARNWLIGSIGSVLDSQWWLPPVGADPEGTYELAGPYYVPPSPFPSPTPPRLGRHVNPYSLYYAQLQQRLKWPASEYREYWAGDIDNFGEVDSPEDAGPAPDQTFLDDLRRVAGGVPVSRFLDRLSPTQQLAMTFTVPLQNPARVVAASLVLALKATGPAAPDDLLYLDSTNAPVPLRAGGLGWDIRKDRVTVETLEVDPALLNDGQLHVSIRKNIAVDWAVLHVQVTPLAPLTVPLPPSDDTYARGGGYKAVVHGFDPDFRVKNEGDGENSRQAYLLWRMPSFPANPVGATVRLYCTGNGQPGNVYGVSLTQHDDWSERSLTWNNQPGAQTPFAYITPESGRWVEFSVLPQAIDAMGGDRRLSLHLWAPYDLGDAGWAIFASRQHPDTNLLPQLVLTFSNAAPAMTTVSNQSMNASTTLGPLAITVSDAETPAAALVLSARSSNPTLLPDASISISTLGSGRFLALTPAANRTGISEIELSLNDGDQIVRQKFLVRVGPPASAPNISAITNQMLLEDTPSPRIPFTISDPSGRARELPVAWTITSFLRNPPLMITQGRLDDPATTPGPTSQRYLVLTPAANFSGVSTVDLMVTDGFQSVTQSFQVTVARVDDPPGPVTLNEPAPGEILPVGEPLFLLASIVDFERDLARIEFRLGTNLIGIATNAPYRLWWTNAPAGLLPITATAFDRAGQRSDSPTAFYQVGPPSEDQAESPPFLSIRADGNTVTVTWDTDGRDLQLQVADRPGPNAVWTDVTAALMASDGNSATFISTNATQQFFRLR